jgi:hypothetical protein
MGPSTLDNLDTPGMTDEIIPFQFREVENEEGTHEWLKNWFDCEYEKAFPRYVMYRRYLNMYKNLDEVEGDGLARTSARDRGTTRKKPRVRDNFIFSYTEQRVSQVSRKKTALTFIPRVHNSQEDINAAKAAKLLIRARYEAMDFDGDMIRMDRTTYLLGHSAYETCWSPDEGPIAPSYERAKKKYEGKVPVIDEATGTPVEGKFYDRPLKVGDTKGRLWQPYQFFPERGHGKDKLIKCDYIDTFEWLPRQYVEKKWKRAELSVLLVCI